MLRVYENAVVFKVDAKVDLIEGSKNVNADSNIGLEEVICILHTVSKLRE
jgi:hypothetical protein